MSIEESIDSWGDTATFLRDEICMHINEFEELGDVERKELQGEIIRTLVLLLNTPCGEPVTKLTLEHLPKWAIQKLSSKSTRTP